MLLGGSFLVFKDFIIMIDNLLDNLSGKQLLLLLNLGLFELFSVDSKCALRLILR